MIVLLHGIHAEGQNTVVDEIAAYLGQPFLYPDYGYILAVETRRINPAVVGALLPYIGEKDVLIGHSNGCCIAYRIAQQKPVKGLVLIDGALKRDLVLPSWVEFCDVYFNAGDDITEVAEAAARIPGFPVDPMWGDLGHAGYSGDDKRVTNIDCGATQGLPVVSGHSDISVPGKIEAWGPYIAARLTKVMQS